jgi:hypothetical protein
VIRGLDLALPPGDAHVIRDRCAAGFRIDNVLEDQPGGVDLAIPERKTGAQLIVVELGFKFADFLLTQSAMMANRMLAREEIIEEKTRAKKPAIKRAVARNEEFKRPYQLRRDAKQRGAFPQRLAHKLKIEILQIAEASMNQLRISAARARREVPLIDQSDSKIAFTEHQVTRDSSAVDAASGDQDIESL